MSHIPLTKAGAGIGLVFALTLLGAVPSDAGDFHYNASTHSI